MNVCSNSAVGLVDEPTVRPVLRALLRVPPDSARRRPTPGPAGHDA
jgi:hypothetical protein